MSQPNGLLIRTARRQDVDSIVTFSMAMARETENRRLDKLRLLKGTRTLLDSPGRGFFVVAEAGEGEGARLVGQLMITFEWSDWRNAVFWWIQSVYVAPAWRRQGVYRRMHDTIIKMARKDPKVCGVRLYVERDNHTAQTVYRRVGLAPSVYVVYEEDFILTRSSHVQSSDTIEEPS